MICDIIILICVDAFDWLRLVSGIWANRPMDWPKNVPFGDPNNYWKAEAKQRKEKPDQLTLMKMFEFLVKKYKVDRTN